VKIEAVADHCQDVLAALGQVVVGKAEVLQRLLAGVLAQYVPSGTTFTFAALLAALVAYTYQEKKPSLNLHPDDLAALPATVF